VRAHLARVLDSDLLYSFRRSRITVAAALVALVLMVYAFGAPWITPQDPFDMVNVDLMDALTPPAWLEGGSTKFFLGTDDQGRDMYSAILYGARLSLVVGIAAVVFSLIVGVGLGLLSGYLGGWVDGLVMRAADVQLSFPAILIALLINGVARGVLPKAVQDEMALYVIVVAIGISG